MTLLLVEILLTVFVTGWIVVSVSTSLRVYKKESLDLLTSIDKRLQNLEAALSPDRKEPLKKERG